MIAALALLMVQAPVAAPAPPPAKAAVSAEARAFGEAYVPSEMTTRSAVEIFRTEAAKAMAQQPAIVALEKRAPGALAKLLDAGAQVIERSYRERLPAFQQRVAAVAATGLAPDELRSVTQFLLSPTGKALQRAVAANIDTGRIADAGRANGKLTTGDIVGAVDIAGSLQAMTPEQIGELARFGTTDAGRRFQSVVPKLQAAIADETNKVGQEVGPAVAQAIMMTMRSLAAPAKGK